VNPINSNSVKSPGLQCAQAFYESIGKPPHVKHKGPQWRQLADLILSEERYQLEHVLGAIRWFPSNDFWRRRLTDFQDFKDNIDKVLSEYHASLPRHAETDTFVNYEKIAQKVLELGFRKTCVMCTGTGEYFKEDKLPRKCLACQDELAKIYVRLKWRPPGSRADPYGHLFRKRWEKEWAMLDRTGCECKGTGYVLSDRYSIKTLDGRDEFIQIGCPSCRQAKEELRLLIAGG
jgi:hypothetical protein